MVREWIAVALGGMVGTILRHGLNSVFRAIHPQSVPWATLAVNVVGCVAIGFLAKWALDRGHSDSWWEVAVRVGLLGGLTTFSSFGFEVIRYWQADRPWMAAGTIAMHVLLGLGGVLLGMNWASRY